MRDPHITQIRPIVQASGPEYTRITFEYKVDGTKRYKFVYAPWVITDNNRDKILQSVIDRMNYFKIPFRTIKWRKNRKGQGYAEEPYDYLEIVINYELGEKPLCYQR